jgi:hypothetical protein
MLFGWIVRSGTFAINAGLVFLLAQQAPRLGLWDAQPSLSVFEQYRGNILAGLSRVRADLESHGKLLLPAPEAAGHPAPATGHTGDL